MVARPGTQTEQATAAALVEAGRELFARHGYDGASVRALTAKAGANLGAITYHFGSKRALYDRVVESCVAPLAERVEAVAVSGGAPLDRIGAVVRAYFEHLRANPEIPHVLLQELAVGRAPPEAAVGPIRRILTAIVSIVRAGQAEGAIRAGRPLVLGIGVISQALHFSLMREPLRELMGLDLDDPETWETVVGNSMTFARGGLAAHAGKDER